MKELCKWETRTILHVDMQQSPPSIYRACAGQNTKRGRASLGETREWECKSECNERGCLHVSDRCIAEHSPSEASRLHQHLQGMGHFMSFPRPNSKLQTVYSWRSMLQVQSPSTPLQLVCSRNQEMLTHIIISYNHQLHPHVANV